MNLQQFLNNQQYHQTIIDIILDIKVGSIQMYQKLNEETSDIYGPSGLKNIQNEEVQKLDLIANHIFIEKFKKNNSIAKLLSEENEEIINLNSSGNYLVAMDPLDGSSNIDVNIPVGSIFSILENNNNGFLQPGKNQKLACYVIYGTTTMMVFAINSEVHGFSLNTKTKEYILTHQNIKTPLDGIIFSINEGNNKSIDTEIVEFTNYCKKLNSNGKRTHTGRFIGSLIADFHRNMLKGGIFIYPKTSDRPNGQLRLIYECNPIAYIARAAASEASNLKNNILDVVPKNIHERTPFVVGSVNMVQKLLSFYKK
jgi:fructose-1,6-bisphosphatase I|tara:strand:+ start:1061 stop:1996 length:936 start_codon:yes stop_codon:yes gene_type:complete